MQKPSLLFVKKVLFGGQICLIQFLSFCVGLCKIALISHLFIATCYSFTAQSDHAEAVLQPEVIYQTLDEHHYVIEASHQDPKTVTHIGQRDPGKSNDARRFYLLVRIDSYEVFDTCLRRS